MLGNVHPLHSYFLFFVFCFGKFKCDSRIFITPLCTGNCSILGNVHRLDSALDIDEASIWLFWRPPLRRLATLWFVGGTLYFNYVQTYRATFLLKGQLVSKGHFGVFKSTKKPTKFLRGFLP